MRAEVEDAAAPVGGEPLAERLTVPSPAHRGVDFEDLPEPPFAGGVDAELDRRIAAEHVGHLQNDVIFPAEVEQFVELLEVLAAGFIHVHVDAAFGAAHGGRHKFGHLGLHRDGVEAGIIENFFLRHPAQPLVAGAFSEGFPVDGGFGADADDFELLRHGAHRRHLAFGVLVADADLSDSDSFFHQ